MPEVANGWKATVLGGGQPVASAIVAPDTEEKLQLRLSAEDKQKMARRATANPYAYRLYLKGRFFAGKFTKEGVEKGLGYFRQAIDIDPTYALAYVGLAGYYTMTSDIYVPAQEAGRKAKAAAQQARELG